MKKIFVIAAATIMVASCGKSELDNWNGEIRLSSGLTIEDGNTRAANSLLAENFAMADQLGIFISEVKSENQDLATVTAYDQPLTYTAGEEGVLNAPSGKQPYFPTSGNGVSIYAIYPLSAAVTDLTTAFTINADQSSDPAYKASDLLYGRTASPTIARTASTIPLTFTHLLSKIQITLIPGSGMTVAELSGAKVELSGVRPTTTLSTKAGTITAASGTATDVKVMTTTATSMTGSAVIVPQTLEGTFIKVTLADGGILTSHFDAAPVFASSSYYTYNITVNLTELNVTSTITAWTPIGAISGTATMD